MLVTLGVVLLILLSVYWRVSRMGPARSGSEVSEVDRQRAQQRKRQAEKAERDFRELQRRVDEALPRAEARDVGLRLERYAELHRRGLIVREEMSRVDRHIQESAADGRLDAAEARALGRLVREINGRYEGM